MDCLIWADDVILLSESDVGLHEMITTFSKWGQHRKNEGNYLLQRHKLNNQFIHTTNSYKYLGFVMTPSGEISTGLKVKPLRFEF